MNESSKRRIDDIDETKAEYLGRWFAMRQYAIEIGTLAERALAREGQLRAHKRHFISRDEWHSLTKGADNT